MLRCAISLIPKSTITLQLRKKKKMVETRNSINTNVNNPYPNEHLVYWDCKRNFVYFNKKTKNLGVYIYIYIYLTTFPKKKHTHIILFILHYISKMLFYYQVFYYFISLIIKILKNKFVYKVINSNHVYLQGFYN